MAIGFIIQYERRRAGGSWGEGCCYKVSNPVVWFERERERAIFNDTSAFINQISNNNNSKCGYGFICHYFSLWFFLHYLW
jgi:hypothetical protein